MKALLSFVIKYFLLWVVFFLLSRILFVVYHLPSFLALTKWNKLFLFVHGLRMDFSLAGYVCILPFILSFFLHKLWYHKGLQIFSYLCAFLFVAIAIPDLELYKAWKYRMEYSAIDYFKSIAEMRASIDHISILPLIIFMTACLFLFHISFKKITPRPALFTAPKGIHYIVNLVCIALLILPMRGGIGIAPLNPGAAYFSNQIFANHAAINVGWNFLYTAVNKQIDTNPFVYIEDDVADSLFNKMMTTTPTSNKLFHNKTMKPNVLILLWESFTHKVVDQKHNGIEITPGFNKWKKQGIYFNNAYASGDRTEKGLAATLSGYPAQPIASIVKSTSKAGSLPILSKSFLDSGYSTRFYYGGDVDFANMNAYLVNGQFQKIISKRDFTTDQKTTKWGAHDHHLFAKYLADKSEDTPFFDVVLTLSSHEPFDVPMDRVINGEDELSLFYNSMHYTDRCLFDFLSTASKTKWWSNTIIIILGDHGHRLPATNKKVDEFTLPILFTGGAVDTSYQIDKVFSQTDIAATLLDQLDLNYKEYLFSKPYGKSPQWAYFSFNNGYGWVEENCYYIYSNPAKLAIENNQCDEKLMNNGKIFQQLTFDHYLDCDKK